MDFNWYVDHRLVHEFHTSGRKSFRGCRQRWDWIFRDGLYPKVTEKPLDFGTAYHAALEAYYDPDSWQFPREVQLEYAIKVFKDKTNAQRKLAKGADQYRDPDEIDKDFDERIVLGIGMLRHLVKSIAPQEDQTWQPLKVEVEFMVPIPHPVTNEPLWCKCDGCWAKHLAHGDRTLGESREGWKGLPVVYAGRIDCVGIDNHGDIWIIDWKTAARIPDNHSFLILDDQIVSYCWALWSIGMNVRGFIYHEQKKGFPVPPKRNQNVRLGRMYSIAANQDTDYATYKATVEKEDPKAYALGLYDTMLNMLKTEGMVFYYRAQEHKTETALLEMQKNLGNEVLDMLADDLRIYPNPSRFGCDRCAFAIPCTEKQQGGDYQYALDTMYEKKTPYYLREESSTDKKSAM